MTNNPIDWACGECDQQPGEPCLDLPSGEFHESRFTAAHTYSDQPGLTPSMEEFDKAVEESGDV